MLLPVRERDDQAGQFGKYRWLKLTRFRAAAGTAFGARNDRMEYQLAYAVGFSNCLFHCSGLRIALAEPAAQAAPDRYNETRRRASISAYPAHSG
jgi:hypothetical protein